MFTEIFARTKTVGGFARSLAATALLLGAAMVTSVAEMEASVPASATSWESVGHRIHYRAAFSQPESPEEPIGLDNQEPLHLVMKAGPARWYVELLLGLRWRPEGNRARVGAPLDQPSHGGGLGSASLADTEPPPPPPPEEPEPVDRDTDILTLTVGEPSAPEPEPAPTGSP